MSTVSQTPQLVQFLPLHSVISPNFWHTLTNLKLNHLRLSEDAVSVRGTYGAGRVVKDGSASDGSTVGIASGLILDETSFEGPAASTSTSSSNSSSSISVPVKGTLLNFNTAPQFTQSDKNAIFNRLSNEIFEEMRTSQHPTDALVRFTVLAFADLKKYKYYHWVAIPALIPSSNWYTSTGWTRLEQVDEVKAPLEEHVRMYRDSSDAGFALVKGISSGQVTLGPVSDLDDFFRDVPEAERTVLFIDPSSTAGVPGWPLRNLLALLSIRFGVRKIRVISWRDELKAHSASPNSITSELFLSSNDDEQQRTLTRDGLSFPLASLASDSSQPSATGWERNASGKLAPKVSDLGPLMDPARLAEQAVDLNLKLMRWRIMPDIQLEEVTTTRCLLLGAGTLGCHVARILLGWGVRQITFVDSSRVSYSNPVRQPLFEFQDCMDGGRPKAECAASRLSKIFPGAKTRGVQLSIPMPGHGLLASDAESSAARKSVQELEALFDEHDVVFLLMDSRESRWLPTLLGSAKNKLVINAALGFDTYLVMRHGAGATATADTEEQGTVDYDKAPSRLGCYFCNDIVAPADSLTDRTLDQMCTVSRPGLAAIAGACAVELMVSILQHEAGANAPAPRPAQTTPSSSASDPPTCLGILPHQIRGQLSTFSSTNITGSSFNKCTACSSIVAEEYRSNGWEMLKLALGQEGYLEKLTGLDKMYEETERLLLSEDGGIEEWSEEE